MCKYWTLLLHTWNQYNGMYQLLLIKRRRRKLFSSQFGGLAGVCLFLSKPHWVPLLVIHWKGWGWLIWGRHGSVGSSPCICHPPAVTSMLGQRALPCQQLRHKKAGITTLMIFMPLFALYLLISRQSEALAEPRAKGWRKIVFPQWEGTEKVHSKMCGCMILWQKNKVRFGTIIQLATFSLPEVSLSE